MERWNEELLIWWRGLSVGVYKERRAAILEACRISRFVWARWLSGRTKIPYLYRREIERVAQERIFSDTANISSVAGQGTGSVESEDRSITYSNELKR